MVSRSIVVALSVGVSLVQAFEGTFPVLAWSDTELSSLALLSPSHPSHTPTVFRSSPQSPFPPTASSHSSDLCTLSSILLISAPGLHSSDFTLLPPSSSSIRTSLASAGASKTLNVPYIPIRRDPELATSTKFVKSFVSECGAVVQAGLEKSESAEKSFWEGGERKTLRVEVVEGLAEWKLTGGRARRERRELVARIDAVVKAHLANLPGPYLVIITSLPSLPVLSHKKPHHAKRQFLDPVLDDADSADSSLPAVEASEYADSSLPTAEYYDDATADDAATDPDADEYEEVPSFFSDRPVLESVAGSAFAPNATSVFQPDPRGGLFSRYVFFSSSLIFALLVSFLIVIPILLFTSTALLSTQTVAGLEAKMTGTVGLDPSKA